MKMDTDEFSTLARGKTKRNSISKSKIVIRIFVLLGLLCSMSLAFAYSKTAKFKPINDIKDAFILQDITILDQQLEPETLIICNDQCLYYAEVRHKINALFESGYFHVPDNGIYGDKDLGKENNVHLAYLTVWTNRGEWGIQIKYIPTLFESKVVSLEFCADDLCQILFEDA